MTVTKDEMIGTAPVRKVSIDEALWSSTQRLLARMMVSWEHSLRESRLLLSLCQHDVGCPATADPRIPCLMSCADRETWLSAKVVENNALEFIGQLGPFSRNHPYNPPTREYWDRIIGELESLRGARDWLQQLDERTGAAAPPSSSPKAAVERPTSRLIREPLEHGDVDEPETFEEGIAS